MKFFLNYSAISKFDKDILWFVAQDIEHIKTLHKKTNSEIRINNITKSENKKICITLLNIQHGVKF